MRLRCTADGLRGYEVDLLTPFEAVELEQQPLRPERAGRLATWRLYHSAFLLEQSLGTSAVLAGRAARLEPQPYQLVPLMKVLQLPRPRLLLADDVGLGKTVEAALVAAELVARRRAHRILIVTPSGPLMTQWERELRSRFGLRFRAIRDGLELQEIRRGLPMGANPFDSIPLCLLGMDFAKTERVLQELERVAWDLVMIDEVHHCARLGVAGDVEDTQRRRLAEVLARQSDALLALTATPHDGVDAHFASLIELLDPSLLKGDGTLRGDRYRRHVVRRLKRHVRDAKTGEPLFRQREVIPVPVTPHLPEYGAYLSLQRGILDLALPRLRSAKARRRYAEVLTFVTLMKRAVSSAAACRRTLERTLARFDDLARSGGEAEEDRKQRLKTLRDLRRRLERYGTLSADEERDVLGLEAEDLAADLFSGDSEQLDTTIDTLVREGRRAGGQRRRHEETRDELSRLVEIARAAERDDAKLDVTLAELLKVRVSEPRANVLLYTEYADSQQAVVAALRAAVEQGALHGEILALSGADDDATRERITGRFTEEDGLILVSTDATSEGLNLHRRCHHLLHLELPFNPNRIEQRNGRIDRFSQRETPIVRYLYLCGGFEERLLSRLVLKYERQRARLTFMPDTLGLQIAAGGGAADKLVDALLADAGNGLFASSVEDGAHPGEEEDTLNPAYRELLAEIDRALEGVDRLTTSHAWLGVEGANADTHAVTQADAAAAEGGRLLGLDLLEFVGEAARLENQSADAVRNLGPDLFAISVPAPWREGVDGLPGYEPATGTLRITTDPSRDADHDGRPLGYLTRGHPVVSRAIERVRNQQLGGAGNLDRRVSAVRADVSAPTLLYTYLVGTESPLGRELERVVAVAVDPTGQTCVLESPQEWLAMAADEHGVPTGMLWEQRFASFAAGTEEVAARAAQAWFEPLGERFAAERREAFDRDLDDVHQWLTLRAEEITGSTEAQEDLFTGTDHPGGWRSEVDPLVRLCEFAQDRSVPAARRREAEGVLSLARRRKNDLAQRRQLDPLAPRLLGLLMLIPNSDRV